MKQLSKEQLNYLNEEKKGNSTIDESIIIPSMETSNSLLNLPSVCQGRVKSNIPYQNLPDGTIIAMNVHKSNNFLSNVKIILAYMSVASYYFSHSNSDRYVLRHLEEQ